MTADPTQDRADQVAAPDGRGRLILVGNRRTLRRLAGCLNQPPLVSLPIVGSVDVSGRGRQLVVHPRSAPVPILGRIDRLDELVRRTGATDLLIALRGRSASRHRRRIARLGAGRVRVHWIDERLNLAGTEELGAPPRWTSLRAPWPLRSARIGKRLLDIAGALIGLTILAPLLLIAGLLIWVTSGRPIFYRQERVGQGGRLFRIIKFRSMRIDAERSTGPIWASWHDERCTRIGDWLRRTNIDELPQLWNVLVGDMSLVGPRPERPMFVESFRAELPDYDYRHAVPAGMTGWAQVHGWRGRTSLRKRIQYDLDYIRLWSFGLDVRILLMTVQHVLWNKTRWEGRGVRRWAR
jgi:exopolysaccharide biosynthesis polyprenyl glycosylphosphotransferase